MKDYIPAEESTTESPSDESFVDFKPAPKPQKRDINNEEKEK